MRFRYILHMFHLDVVKVDLVLRMLQWLYTCVKCIFQIFQLFYLDVVNILFGCCICCSGYRYMFQVCFLNVLTILFRRCMFSSVRSILPPYRFIRRTPIFQIYQYRRRPVYYRGSFNTALHARWLLHAMKECQLNLGVKNKRNR